MSDKHKMVSCGYESSTETQRFCQAIPVSGVPAARSSAQGSGEQAAMGASCLQGSCHHRLAETAKILYRVSLHPRRVLQIFCRLGRPRSTQPATSTERRRGRELMEQSLRGCRLGRAANFARGRSCCLKEQLCFLSIVSLAKRDLIRANVKTRPRVVKNNIRPEPRSVIS